MNVDKRTEANVRIELHKAAFFSTRLPGAVQASPIAYQGRYYVASRDGNLFAIDPSQDNPVIEFSTPSLAGSVAPPLATSLGIVLSVLEGKMWMLDTSNRKALIARWQIDLEEELHYTPVRYGNELLVVTADGNLVALNIQTGDKLWNFSLGKRRAIAQPDTVRRQAVSVIGRGQSGLRQTLQRTPFVVNRIGNPRRSFWPAANSRRHHVRRHDHRPHLGD